MLHDLIAFPLPFLPGIPVMLFGLLLLHLGTTGRVSGVVSRLTQRRAVTSETDFHDWVRPRWFDKLDRIAQFAGLVVAMAGAVGIYL